MKKLTTEGTENTEGKPHPPRLWRLLVLLIALVGLVIFVRVPEWFLWTVIGLQCALTALLQLLTWRWEREEARRAKEGEKA